MSAMTNKGGNGQMTVKAKWLAFYLAAIAMGGVLVYMGLSWSVAGWQLPGQAW